MRICQNEGGMKYCQDEQGWLGEDCRWLPGPSPTTDSSESIECLCNSRDEGGNRPSTWGKGVNAHFLLVTALTCVLSVSYFLAGGVFEPQSFHYAPHNEQQRGIQNDRDGMKQRRRLQSLANYVDPKTVTLRSAINAISVSDVDNEESPDIYPNNLLNPDQATNSDADPPRNPIPNPKPYTLQNIQLTLPTFYRELFLLHYDPAEDIFNVYINERKDRFVMAVRNRLNVIMPVLTMALRQLGDEFRGTSDNAREFFVLVSSGDEPKLSCECVSSTPNAKALPGYCKNDLFAPILQFGSVYTDQHILPSTITMPVWHHMVPCFREWQQGRKICDSWMSLAMTAEIEPASVWDSLIPQVVWRGTDFGFLHCLHKVRGAEFEKDILPRLSRLGETARGVAMALMEAWDDLTPRWKGVALTVVEEMDTKEQLQDARAPPKELPWIDVKFTIKSSVFGKEVDPSTINPRYTHFQNYGIDTIGDRKSLADLAHYKYQIDFGGGGGTTWTGTMEKLAMPGVLFHHVTESKDYFHDDLIPWGHYIPVSSDVSDLREKFEWAEQHPEEALRIAEAGSQFMRDLGTKEVVEKMYNRYFVDSLREVVKAYRPMEEREREEVLKEILSPLTLVAQCTGMSKMCTFLKTPQI